MVSCPIHLSPSSCFCCYCCCCRERPNQPTGMVMCRICSLDSFPPVTLRFVPPAATPYTPSVRPSAPLAVDRGSGILHFVFCILHACVSCCVSFGDKSRFFFSHAYYLQSVHLLNVKKMEESGISSLSTFLGTPICCSVLAGWLAEYNQGFDVFEGMKGQRNERKALMRNE